MASTGAAVGKDWSRRQRLEPVLAGGEGRLASTDVMLLAIIPLALLGKLSGTLLGPRRAHPAAFTPLSTKRRRTRSAGEHETPVNTKRQ